MAAKRIPNHRYSSWSFGGTAFSLLKETLMYETCLTEEDVERASGLCKISKVPHHPSKFMGGDLNFVNEQGEKILCVVFATASQFEMFKSSTADGVSTRAIGIGEEAFAGHTSADPATQFLVFRKGGHAAFLLAPAPAREQQIRLTLPQLLDIGKIITTRLA